MYFFVNNSGEFHSFFCKGFWLVNISFFFFRFYVVSYTSVRLYRFYFLLFTFFCWFERTFCCLFSCGLCEVGIAGLFVWRRHAALTVWLRRLSRLIRCSLRFPAFPILSSRLMMFVWRSLHFAVFFWRRRTRANTARTPLEPKSALLPLSEGKSDPVIFPFVKREMFDFFIHAGLFSIRLTTKKKKRKQNESLAKMAKADKPR